MGKNSWLAIVTLLAAVAYVAIRGFAKDTSPHASGTTEASVLPRVSTPTPAASLGPPTSAYESSADRAAAAPKESALASTGDNARDTQIRRVVASMDETRRPPEGVAQGGNPPGNFRNREGRLPRGDTYIESDIWPSRGRSRGTERLIFGKDRAVWFTGDHYETFKRLR